MAKGNTFRHKRFVMVFVLLCILIIIGIYLRQSNTHIAMQPSPTPTISPANLEFLVDAAIWYPSAPWTTPAPVKAEQTYYGKLSGDSITATITANTASINHFEDIQALAAKGFVPDKNLAADGPGSSTWGYKKNDYGNQQVIIFSYKTQPTNSSPNEPLQFNCPCKVNITVFVSNTF